MAVFGPAGSFHIDPREPLLFISAAEPSGDMHGASLIRATLARRPAARFVGVAGRKMVQAGCEPIFDMTAHSAMLLGAIGSVGRAIKMLGTAGRHLRRLPLAGAVVIDSPTLHLPLAARAKRAGVPVMYYIAPQMWAWGAHRIGKLRRRVDRVAVILPFEEKYFRDRGVPATYVGHPLADLLADQEADSNAVSEIRGYGQPVVALLPGSRRHVVKEVLPGQLQVAERIAAALPGAGFGVSVANEQVDRIIRAELAGCNVPVHRCPGRHTELIQASDLVLAASGTTTLEVAFHKKPMIVMYNSSRILYHVIGRWMIKAPHLSLPNILAGREIVPEFMPYYNSAAPIAERAITLLRSEDERRTMAEELSRITEPMRTSHASDRAAKMLLDMIDGVPA